MSLIPSRPRITPRRPSGQRARWSRTPPSSSRPSSRRACFKAAARRIDMSKILVIAEHLDGKLNGATARAVSAAVAAKPESIDVIVLSDAPEAVAAAAAKIDGVSKVLTVARAENAHALAAILAPQIAKAAAGYTHV